MTRIYVQNIRSQTGAPVDFKDVISVNGDKQWLDTYGIIKTNRNTINENVTIPAGTNGVSVGAITISAGRTVTVRRDWRIV